MNFLSLFVLIPLLMLLGLWLSKGIKAIRGVMVVGASALVVCAVALVIMYLNDRAAGAEGEMLYTASFTWFEPLHIKYSVGVDGISVAMLLLSAIIVFTGTFASWKLKPLTKEYFLWFTLLSTGAVRILYLDRPVHDVHVLRDCPHTYVPSHRSMGQRPQGIFGHEADAYAYGRFRVAYVRHFRNLLRCRRPDVRHS